MLRAWVAAHAFLVMDSTFLSSIKLDYIRHDICRLTMDVPGKSANVLTDEFFAELDATLESLAADPPAGVILISAKPSIYVAGADLVKISRTLDWSDQQIIHFCEEGRRIMGRINQLPSVSVAAIHGACVGGGLELTLWCDIRIASDHPRTLLGLPEVKLGLVPGWAGTVRLPRLIGLEPAVELVTTGKLLDSSRAQELGIVSDVVPQDRLIERSIELIDEQLKSPNYWSQRERLAGPVTKLPDDITAFQAKVQADIDCGREVHPQAPTIALEHMVRTASLSAVQACASEAVAMSQVYGSNENAGLLHYFFLDERAKKTRPQFKNGERPDIQSIGIVGAGWIGSQIIRLSLAAGFQVTVYDADQKKQERLVHEFSQTGMTKGTLLGASELAQFSECQLVIESVVEKPAIKRQLFESLNSIVSEQAFLATNTSTIPVSEIAPSVSRPQRMIGLHFCCPVEPLKLVEVVRAEQTSELTLNVALDFIKRIRKTPVIVGDRAGFVVNRLLCPVSDQSIQWLQQGLTPAEIDAPFRDFGFAVGPLEMIDVIGVDTIMYAGETLLRYFPNDVSVTPILPALVKRGRLGRKSQKGFYQYPDPAGPAVEDPQLTEILQKYQTTAADGPDPGQLVERLLQSMVEQGEWLLEEGVVKDSRDIDLCSILGTTFPVVRGGLMYWAEHLR